MSSRAAWSVTLAVCLVWIVGGFIWTLSAPERGLLPLLLAVPALIVARLAWRRLRHN